MKKLISLTFILLIGASLWADVLDCNVYDCVMTDGSQMGYSPAPTDVQAVDLGLSVKWASCNVGGEKPEDFGNYYAWGEVLPKYEYNWETYRYANGSSTSLTKYCYNKGKDGFTDSLTTLEFGDDAACMNWGGNWRMPTNAEFDELLNNCTWAWTTQNGVNGYQVTSPINGNSIFLPAAGYHIDRVKRDSVEGYYFSSSLYEESNSRNAKGLKFSSSSKSTSIRNRYQGFSIRPIYSTSNISATLTLKVKGCEETNEIKCSIGQQVNMKAVTREHRHFVQWSDGNTENPRFVTITSDTTFTAEFAADPYLTLVTDEKGYVSGAGSYKPNTSCEISATANYGYHFVQWSDGNTENPRFVTITSDTTFTAEFAADQYTISAEVNDPALGRVEGATTVEYLDSVTLTAVANYGYHFSRWSDWNRDNPRTEQVIENKTYTALFEKNVYTITAQVADMLAIEAAIDSIGVQEGVDSLAVFSAMDALPGSVTAPSLAYYLDQVMIVANGRIGYHFTQWSDGNTENPRTFVITCDTTFTAEFAQTFSGQCGDNLYWSYAGHTLTITGSGEMYDYSEDEAPWLLFRDTTTEVVLERGITHIGNYAFNGFVKLGNIELPNTLTTIGTNAFAGCRKMYYVYSYAAEPPMADNTSFANYNVYLYVLCDYLQAYQMDAVFGSFKYTPQCLGAEKTTADGDVTVTPSDKEAIFVWPADGSADTYTLEIRKDGEVFCTLLFNANGQLNTIAFAPSRDRQSRRAAEQTSNGFRFTVTGLSQSTHYTFGMKVEDTNDIILQNYSGEFNTTSAAAAVDNTSLDALPTKVLIDGQVYIIRNGKTYTVTGAEVK